MPLSVSMLSERRVYRPYGLDGGGSGQAGLNLYLKELDGTERVINIGGKMELEVQPRERILIHTPGGGGWGTPSEETESISTRYPGSTSSFQARGSVYAFNQTAEAAQ